MICENVKCFQRAARLKESVAQAGGNEGIVTINFCCVDWLYSPTLCADATRRAAKANVVIFLGEVSSAFPKRFEDWLKTLPWSVSRVIYGIAADSPAEVINISDSNRRLERTPAKLDGRSSVPDQVVAEIFGGETWSHETLAREGFEAPAVSANN